MHILDGQAAFGFGQAMRVGAGAHEPCIYESGRGIIVHMAFQHLLNKDRLRAA